MTTAGEIFRAVVPAHAGVILCPALSPRSLACGSRTRGGDPVEYPVDEQVLMWFPHTRG